MSSGIIPYKDIDYRDMAERCLRSRRGCVIKSQGNELVNEVRAMQIKKAESPGEVNPQEDDTSILSIEEAIKIVKTDESFRNSVTSGLLMSMGGSVCGENCSFWKTLKGKHNKQQRNG